MTTPNKQNEDHPNGTSDRGASSSLSQRSRPASSEEGRSEAPSVVAERTAPEGDKHEELSDPASSSTKIASGAGSDTGSSSALPQREPQTNLNRPGHSPVIGRSVGLNSGATNARTTADLAAKAARKEAAMVKSVGIDGPTRSIARPELIKDLPDLSDLRHPLPTAPAAPMPMAPMPEPHHSGPMPQVQQVPVVPMSPAAPAAVAHAATMGEPLRATVQVRHIDPWSTLKVSLVISVAMFFVWMLAVGFLYIVLSGMGVWDRMSSFFSEAGDTGASSLIDAGAVFGYAAVVGLINVVLLTALSTVGVFIYNQCTDLVGGVQVTMADPD